MKQRINTIKGKRLVRGGGTNLLRNDEILVTETNNGIQLQERQGGNIVSLSSGENENSEYLYYKINWEVFPEDTSNDLIYIGTLFPKDGYVVLQGEYKYMRNTEVDTHAGYSWGGRRQIYVRTPKTLVSYKVEDEYSVTWYKVDKKNYLDYIMKTYSLQFLEEVTKEEYESFVQVRMEDMEYKELIIE